MNSSSTPSLSQHEHLSDRDTTQQHRPVASSHLIHWPSSQTVRNRLRTLLQRRLTHRPEDRGCPESDSENLLAHVFGSPQGAGLIGPGADALERTALTELFTCDLGATQIVIEEQDFKRVFGDAFADAQRAAGTRLRMVELLEDAIEYIESETETVPESDAIAPSNRSPAIIWFVTPCQHADVIHQVLRQRRNPQVIALVSGAWAYGPTHFIAADGPRKLPPRPIELLTTKQAVGKLRAFSDREPT